MILLQSQVARKGEVEINFETPKDILDGGRRED
jgi:hypothetical protein